MVDRDVEAVLGKLGPEARRDTVDARVEQRLVGPQLGSEAVERLHARGTAACLAQGGVLGDQRGDARPGGKRIDALREADPNEAGRKRVSRPVVAGKPLAGTVAANVLEHATGALNIDGCRIDVPVGGIRPLRIPGTPRDRGIVYGSGRCGSAAVGETELGRWPANVILDEEAGALLEEQTGRVRRR